MNKLPMLNVDKARRKKEMAKESGRADAVLKRFDEARKSTRYLSGWNIYYDPPPIPTRQFDWHFYHDNYDGAPNWGGDDDPGPTDWRCGRAASLEDCKKEIDNLIEEHGEP